MTTTEPDPTIRTRSWSQLSDWECPELFRLGRIEKVWKRPAAWFAMGTGVHAGLEFWERSLRTAPRAEVYDEFHRVYTDAINESLDETPNTDVWMWSGRYDGGTDIVRRRKLGPEHLDRSIAWYEAHPEERPWALPDGTLAVELDFTVQLGTVPVRGVTDLIVWTSETEDTARLRTRDNKTGNDPGKPMQLQIQAIAANDLIRSLDPVDRPMQEITEGDFFMTKTGKPTAKVTDLTLVSVDEVTVLFETMDAEIQAGNFRPNPSPDRCRRCPVKDSCAFRED